MCRKIFLLVLLGLSPFLVLGNASVPVLAKSVSFSVTTDTCDLAAPTNFHVQSIGATWVTLAWIPTVPTADHRVKIFRSSDGSLIGNVVIPAFQAPSTTFNNLVPGETYNATVCAICQDGTDSKYKATISEFDTIIHDLIVSGISPIEGSATCTIDSSGEECDFSLNGSTNVFRVQRKTGSPYRQFNVEKPTGLKSKIAVITIPATPPFEFFIDGQPGNPNGPVEGEIFDVKIQSLTIATFEMYEYNSIGRLRWISGSPYFQITRVTADPNSLSKPPNGYIGQRDEFSTEEQALATYVAPNPFSENLDVFLAQSATEVNLQLYNLSGQKVIAQQFAGEQEQYTLHTTGLAPGFYMLRIEADGAVQTLKVIKSE